MTTSDDNAAHLPLPLRRCLSQRQAAEYLGIGISLFLKLGVRAIRLGRRTIYDRVDLDTWLDEHTGRGRAIKEQTLWPEKEVSIDEKTRRIGGSTWSSPMADEYARALGLRENAKPKST
jgi:hypothetical protein